MRPSMTILATTLLLLISNTFAVPVSSSHRSTDNSELVNVAHTLHNTASVVGNGLNFEHDLSKKPRRSLFRRVYPHTAGHQAAAFAHQEALMAHAHASQAHTNAQIAHTAAGNHALAAGHHTVAAGHYAQAATSQAWALHHEKETYSHLENSQAHNMHAHGAYGKDYDHLDSKARAETSKTAADLSKSRA